MIAVVAPLDWSWWHAFTSWNGWRWDGWEALVAICTVALAATTGILAFFTWRMARETHGVARETRALAAATDAEVNAQWRPVLVPVPMEVPIGLGWRSLSGGDDVIPPTFPIHAAVDVRDESVTIAFSNEGRGPALNVRGGGVDPDTVKSTGTYPQTARAGGDPISLTFAPIPIEDGGETIRTFELAIDYQDLARSWHRSAIVVTQISEPGEELAVAVSLARVHAGGTRPISPPLPDPG